MIFKSCSIIVETSLNCLKIMTAVTSHLFLPGLISEMPPGSAKDIVMQLYGQPDWSASLCLYILHLWPFTRKRTLTVFRWTAKAVGYPVGSVDESVEGVWKAVGFFSLPVEGVEKSRWEISQKPLEKAVGFFAPTRWKRWENSSYPLKDS